MFSDAQAPELSSRSRRRWRFWLLLGGVPILALVLSAVAWLIRANLGLQAAIDEADRLDPRWRLEEIEADRFTPPPGQSAADKIVAVRRLMPGRWPGHANVSQNYKFFDDMSPEHQLNDQRIAALGEILELVGPVLAEARSLIATPLGRHAVVYPLDWFSTLLPTVHDTRWAAALLRFDVYDKAQSGDADGAVRSCHAALNAGSSIGDQPNAVAQMARCAVQVVAVSLLERALAQGEPSDGVLAELQARLAAVEPEPLLLYALRGDRAGLNQFFENVRNDTIPIGTVAAVIGQAGKLDPGIEALLRVPGFVATQQTAVLHRLNEFVEIGTLPPEQWTKPLGVLQAKENELRSFARLFVGAEFQITKGCQRNHGFLRCAIVPIAAERFRRANGNWPATPDDLVSTGLLKSVPNDPFAAGQRIKFARRPDGLTVYSVGENGIDEGGDLTKDVHGIGADLGFRLWDVAARRQAPLPAKPAESP
jgi:hypothetical protein